MVVVAILLDFKSAAFFRDADMPTPSAEPLPGTNRRRSLSVHGIQKANQVGIVREYCLNILSHWDACGWR